MKEIPILYNTQMAIAKREWRKTQTRRIVKPQPDDCYFLVVSEVRDGKFGIWYNYNGMVDCDNFIPCPWQVGDTLWGRETWCYAEDETGNHTATTNGDCFGKWLFRAKGDKPNGHWKPSIFMPKEVAQIWERVVGVRVERLQDISEDDAIAEGIELDPHPYWVNGAKIQQYKNYDLKLFNAVKYLPAKDSYKSLWESINGPGSWELNPWVWVIETEILSTTGKPKDL